MPPASQVKDGLVLVKRHKRWYSEVRGYRFSRDDKTHFPAQISLLLLTDLQHRVFGSFYQPALGLDIRGYGWS